MNWNRSLRMLLKAVIYLAGFWYTLPFLYKLSNGLLANFFASSVSFNLDTVFLNFNTSFPAVTICEIYNGEKIWDLSESQFGAEHDLHIDDFVSEIVFFRGHCSSCDQCDTQPCPANFTHLLKLFRSKCKQLINHCSYINKIFDCCEQFLPIRTEYGLCYSFNSHQARKSSHVQFTNNRITGAGFLRFDAHADIQLHVHGSIDVPFLYAEGLIRETVLLGSYKEVILNVIEVYNHESLADLTWEYRRCRYAQETTAWGRRLGIYEFYSYSTCIVECTVAMHLTYCNCTSHFMSTSDNDVAPMCDFRGLRCLSLIYEKLHTARNSCDCISSCEEPEYNIIYNSEDDEQEPEEDVSHIKVALVELPTQRYVRRVAKTYLDMLISVGGIVGLFFNTSVLRIVELIFLSVENRITFFRLVRCKRRTQAH